MGPIQYKKFKIKRNITTKIEKISNHYPKQTTIRHAESVMLTKNTQISTDSTKNSAIFVKIEEPQHKVSSKKISKMDLELIGEENYTYLSKRN